MRKSKRKKPKKRKRKRKNKTDFLFIFYKNYGKDLEVYKMENHNDSIVKCYQEAIRFEMNNGISQFGKFNSLHEAYSIILEEIDEFWELVKQNPKKMNENDKIIRKDNMIKELIQICSMGLETIVLLEQHDIKGVF